MEQLIRDIKYYFELRIKKLKLTMVEQLSLIFGKLMALIAFILLVAMALLLFTGALTILVAQLLNSYIWAFVIIGGVYLITAAIFFFKRSTLFSGSMVGVFSNLFFGDGFSKKDEEDDDEEEE